jgi:hypothetical protein
MFPKHPTCPARPRGLVAALALALITGSVLAAPSRPTGPTLYPYPMGDPREEARPGIELPESVAPRLEGMTDDEIAFLESGDARRYAGGLDDTVEYLEAHTPEENRAWVQAMRSVVDATRFDPERDAGSIPLNTDSPEFNRWRLIRPRSLDPEREPGPIELGRYGGRGGPPTFGGFPLALTQEDLIAGEVDVAIVGAPLNMGSGWRDSERSTVELRLLGRPMGRMDSTCRSTPAACSTSSTTATSPSTTPPRSVPWSTSGRSSARSPRPAPCP